MAECEIFNNRFVRTRMGKAEEFYGVKGRQGKRCRIHHKPIEVVKMSRSCTASDCFSRIAPH
jgi:hypothetical protein